MANKKEKKYVIDNAKLMTEWDFDKNNQMGIFPDKITCGSSKKVWWKCSNNHVFFASISHREQGRGCPYCANRKAYPGFNDLGTKFPSISKEWIIEKNYPLVPTGVLGGSHQVVWWKCQNGHEYQMSILDRTQGNNCPICSGKRVVKGLNDLFTTHPEMKDEWDWEKNNEIGIFPEEITHGSTKSVWWKCRICGNRWQATPNNRRKTNCPICINRKIVEGKNDLQTNFPNIARKWNYEKNYPLKPTQVSAFSNKTVWWVCDKDSRHIFKARINHLTKGEIVCPVCSNQKIIIGVNDFQTTNLELMQEWDWQRNKELGIFPTKITKGVNKKVWWKCKICGHSWFATVGCRTGEQRCGCPECKKDLSSSFPEKAISFYLSKIFNVEENKKFGWLGNSEIDIYIPHLKLGVEYDGKVWHKDIERDKRKDMLCEENGISLIRVREKSCPNYESSSYKIIRKGFKDTDLNSCIVEIFSFISSQFDIEFKEKIDVASDCVEILAKISTMKKEKSVESSKLIESWNYSKNGKLSPKNVALGSNKKVWWICEKGHEWQAVVSSRNTGIGCPICSGKKVLAGYNDLQTVNPQLAKEWHPTRNRKLTPMDVTARSSKKVWWLGKCGHEWLTKIADRSKGRNCPYCASQKVLVGYNDLATKNPKLAKEWHPTKNGKLKPIDVLPNSNKKVWWLGKCGHEWEATVSARNLGRNCPICSGKKVLVGYNDLETVNPKLAAEWHPFNNGSLTPKNITAGSNKKVWWKCRNGHEWQAVISSRNTGIGCPICSGKKVLTGYNDLETVNPKLAIEWHPYKNGEFKPTDFLAKSEKKAWWKCPVCGNEWQAVISSRNYGRGCPKCANIKRERTNKKKN